MAKKIIEVCVDEHLAHDAQIIYKKLGLDLDDAIKLFLNQTILSSGLPFPLRLSPSEHDAPADSAPAPRSEQAATAVPPAKAEKPAHIELTHEPCLSEMDAPEETHAAPETAPAPESGGTKPHAAQPQQNLPESPDSSAAPEPSQNQAAGADKAETAAGQADADTTAPVEDGGTQTKTSIVDDEEENTDAPKHLFDGWKQA